MPDVVVALLTPFGADGRLDRDALAAHADLLVEAGVDALMPCGTTGEGPLLADEEVAEVVEATLAAAAGRVPVYAHVGRPATAATCALARRAEEAGAAAVFAVVPYYYALADEQLLHHYRALLAAVDVPVYAYTIPARTGNELSPAVVRTLAGEGLKGLKDSTKSFECHLEYLRCGVNVLIGTDALVLEAFRAGAVGCVSALANVRPDLLCALRDGAGEEGQEEVLRLRDELPLQRLKFALAERLPRYPERYRAPLR